MAVCNGYLVGVNREQGNINCKVAVGDLNIMWGSLPSLDEDSAPGGMSSCWPCLQTGFLCSVIRKGEKVPDWASYGEPDHHASIPAFHLLWGSRCA